MQLDDVGLALGQVALDVGVEAWPDVDVAEAELRHDRLQRREAVGELLGLICERLEEAGLRGQLARE